jgi:hypothetical protein
VIELGRVFRRFVAAVAGIAIAPKNRVHEVMTRREHARDDDVVSVAAAVALASSRNWNRRD